ncbi:MAG: polyphosphate--glucose phosphotransferase [Candidatus Limnocylindrales bacterium]|jgi:polyphosphate glucokinase
MAADPSPGDLAIGIDFGGSGIKGAVVDIRTGVFYGDRIRVPTPQPSTPREVVAVMSSLVRRLIDALAAREDGSVSAVDAAGLPVGVGIPSAIRSGTVMTAANIDPAWIGFPAEKELSRVLDRPVAIGNDADVAGLAELTFGAGRAQRGTVVVLTIGTGVGSALFVDGRLVPNTELGHLELKGGDAEVRVAESARDRLGLNWKEWAAGFDEYLHMLERLFWPDLFILGGGASKRADNYLQHLTIKTPVVVATLKNNAGIVGGALLAHERRTRGAVAALGR